MGKTRALFAVLLATVFAPLISLAAEAKEPATSRDARMQWWREARFGMFIHWGIYSELGRGEWVQFNEKIPVKEYEKLAAKFNPVKFNADQWVNLAKQTGCKYIVITAKHHDGFSMFRTKLSPFNIVDATPFKRDPMAELAKACQEQGIKLCFYYSHVREWRHPLAQSVESGNNYGNFWDYSDESKKDLNRFVDGFAKPQLKELLTHYGPIGLIWFDTPSSLKDDKAKECADLVHALQPGCLVNSRVGWQKTGWDYESMGDCEVPPAGRGKDWETPITNCGSWGYVSDPNNQYRPAGELIRTLVHCASMGGNLLLNVGPTAEGVIPPKATGPLERVGKWMQINGESIYGTQASPFKRLAWGRCTQKSGKLYLHVFDWPKGELFVPGLKNHVAKAYLLAAENRSLLAATADEDGVIITLPNDAPDRTDSVVVLEIEGEPEVAPFMITQAIDGQIELAAAEAVIHGETARCQNIDGRDNIGFWTNKNDWLSWDFRVKTPGKFNLEVTFACLAGAEGSEYAAKVADQTLHGKVESTGQWDKFVTRVLGQVNLSMPGRYTLAVKPTSMPHGAVMNLESLTLKPIKN
jgi:alpha-L-fucosidase